MAISSRRAQYLAGASLALGAVFFVIALLIGLWSKFFAVYAVSWLILAGVSIWFVLWLQFYQRTLAEQEKLDTTQLAKGRETTIFQSQDEHATVFAVAQRRLQIFEKWFIPIFSAAIAAYQLGIGLYLFKAVRAWADVETKQPLLVAIFMTAIAFVGFLVSRYATGMSAQPRWKPLRAGGSFFLGIAVLSFVMAVALAMVQFKIFVVITVVNWVIPILLIVLGIETALNVVLDIYRPRLAGKYARSAFDSRLLGLINEPGGILRTAATAIDYQFGFKVSQTWFYKLLEKAVVPLVLFAGVTLYLLSCIVVVAPHEEAIIEHFGNPLTATGLKRLVGPGLTFKWPWPIDIVYKYPAKKVAEISIGFVPKTDPRTKEVIPEASLLWGKAHYEQEHQLLVASEQAAAGSIPGAAPVSLVVAAVPVQYRVKDLYSFLYHSKEPEEVLESICYRELTEFAASAKIEVDDEGGVGESTKESLLGAGRAEAKKVLADRIQKAADDAGLGVEIVFLGLQGIHPPVEVATDYQKVVGAGQEMQALVLEAEAERNKTLSTLVGSVEEADKLHNLASEYQRAEEQNSGDGQIETLAGELDVAFAKAKGDIFGILREAEGYAFEKVSLARATGQRFASQLKAYGAAKEFYMREQVLNVLEESLENVRKYVFVADVNDKQVFIVDLEDKLPIDLLNTYLPSSKEASGK